MTMPPTAFRWNGDVMVPTHPKLAASRFEVGADYLLAPVSVRSEISHDHEFAWLAEAWKTLPERLADQFPTAEHLRKRALIDAGYYHETIVDAGSNAAALRVAAFMKAKDEFALVIVRGPFAIERTAKSQSKRAMDKAEFQASKTAIMEVIADLVGVPVESLLKAQAA
jgi:hypothetical protein